MIRLLVILLMIKLYVQKNIFRYVCDFSVDYDPIAVDDILEIHKYLMRKNEIVIVKKSNCCGNDIF